MKRIIGIGLLAMVAVWGACGDDDDVSDVVDTADVTDPGTPDEGGTDTDAVADTTPEDGTGETTTRGTCPSFSYTLTAGGNTAFPSGGRNRGFQLVVPDAVATGEGPWPVVFLWHGYGDDTDGFISAVRTLAGDAEFPFIAVAPESIPLNLATTPIGFEWDMLEYRSEADGSLDVTLFDDILTCLDEAYGVDADRVYSVGMSAGGIMSAELSIARRDVLASAVVFSGAYFSDSTQTMCMGTLCTRWPEPAGDVAIPILLAWGGTADVYDVVPGVMSINFNDHANQSLTYLNGLGSDVIACNHGEGHVMPAGLRAAQYIRFLRDHPRGTDPTPYATAMPAGFPAYCTAQTAP
jgi:predicted esterase